MEFALQGNELIDHQCFATTTQFLLIVLSPFDQLRRFCETYYLSTTTAPGRGNRAERAAALLLALALPFEFAAAGTLEVGSDTEFDRPLALGALTALKLVIIELCGGSVFPSLPTGADELSVLWLSESRRMLGFMAT